MNLNQITDPLSVVFRFASMACALAAVVKLTGFVNVRFAVMELAAVGILCALAK